MAQAFSSLLPSLLHQGDAQAPDTRGFCSTRNSCPHWRSRRDAVAGMQPRPKASQRSRVQAQCGLSPPPCSASLPAAPSTLVLDPEGGWKQWAEEEGPAIQHMHPVQQQLSAPKHSSPTQIPLMPAPHILSSLLPALSPQCPTY